MRRDPLADFRHPFVQQFRQHDVAGEQFGPILVADAQGVAKALGDQQQGAVALAFQQGVGGDGGAHLHRRDVFGGNRPIRHHAQQLANPVQGGVGVMLGIVRQQLVCHQLPVGTAGDDVGKRAAPVDPELPAGGCGEKMSSHGKYSKGRTFGLNS